MVDRVEACRAFAACHRLSSTMRSSGTSFVIHSDVGFSRATRFPVSGFFYEALPIPDRTADVQLVIQNAGASARVPVNRAGAPGPPPRPRHPFRIQRLGDRLRRDARDECPEDPLHDRRFRRE